MSQDPIYIFIDESGDLLPANLGSSNLVLSAFVTSLPNHVSGKVNELRYGLLSKGIGIANFHAADDSRLVRSEFFQNLIGLEDCFGVSIGTNKSNQLTKSDIKNLYIQMLALIVQEAVVKIAKSSNLILLIDLTLDQASRAAAKRVIKSLCRSFGVKNYIYFLSMKRDGCGQIADYLAWSHFQSLERANHSYFLEIKRLFRIFEVGLSDPPG